MRPCSRRFPPSRTSPRRHPTRAIRPSPTPSEAMAEQEYPDHLYVDRHREAEGRGHQPWVRRTVLSLFFALIVLALLNVFGQRSETARATGSGANVEVHGPTTV